MDELKRADRDARYEYEINFKRRVAAVRAGRLWAERNAYAEPEEYKARIEAYTAKKGEELGKLYAEGLVAEMYYPAAEKRTRDL
jgi:hypothetical protein